MKKVLTLTLFILLISCETSNSDTTKDEGIADNENVAKEVKGSTSDPTINPTALEPEIIISERPGLNNTGPNNSSKLIKSGNVVVDNKWKKGSGTVSDPYIVENLDILGSLKVKTSNVIVRNFRVISNSLYPVQTNNVDGVTNVTLEDGEIMGGNKSSATILAKNGVTLRRLRLHETKGDGIKIQGNDFTMESCWIYNLGLGDKAHADGVQGTVNGEGVRWKNHKYIGNFFDMSISKLAGRYKSNATIFLHVNKNIKNGSSGIDNIVIKDNWLIGGNFCLQVAEGMTNITIKDNKFGHKDKDVRFGNLRIDSPASVSGSVFYDTGKPIE